MIPTLCAVALAVVSLALIVRVTTLHRMLADERLAHAATLRDYRDAVRVFESELADVRAVVARVRRAYEATL